MNPDDITNMRMRAEISLTLPGTAPLGAERIALLEAVGREGSISAAARAVGLGYRGAWEAIGAMNNLAGRPLVTGRTGGKGGGGAALTPDGVRLVESFRRLEAEMARAFVTLAPDLSQGGAEGGPDPVADAARLMFGGFLRTSARNALRGTVTRVEAGPVNAEVALDIAGGQLLVVTLTSRSVRGLGLFPGRPAIALVKAPLIRLAPAGAAIPTCRNRLEGVVAAVEHDPETIELTLDIGGGKSLVVIEEVAAATGLAVGAPAVALIDPAHVILAIE